MSPFRGYDRPNQYSTGRGAPRRRFSKGAEDMGARRPFLLALTLSKYMYAIPNAGVWRTLFDAYGRGRPLIGGFILDMGRFKKRAF